jgi:hypothetical protein
MYSAAFACQRGSRAADHGNECGEDVHCEDSEKRWGRGGGDDNGGRGSPEERPPLRSRLPPKTAAALAGSLARYAWEQLRRISPSRCFLTARGQRDPSRGDPSSTSTRRRPAGGRRHRAGRLAALRGACRCNDRPLERGLGQEMRGSGRAVN